MNEHNMYRTSETYGTVFMSVLLYYVRCTMFDET